MYYVSNSLYSIFNSVLLITRKWKLKCTSPVCRLAVPIFYCFSKIIETVSTQISQYLFGKNNMDSQFTKYVGPRLSQKRKNTL